MELTPAGRQARRRYTAGVVVGMVGYVLASAAGLAIVFGLVGPVDWLTVAVAAVLAGCGYVVGHRDGFTCGYMDRRGR